MGAVILALVLGFFAIYKVVLAVSPFKDLQLPEAYGTALSWLNWLLPINDMVTLFNAWLAAVALCLVAFFLIKLAMRFGFSLAGV